MPDLKNIRQIGSPADTDKIYVENRAYQRIHREEFPERRVFVLMGHTECAPGGYTTFVEAVIPVWEIAFLRGVPVWNSHVWNTVFGEVKRSFENSVIIGWALDAKGMPPRMNADLEAVHKEHFGGAHQLLFLLDTLEQEEYFYQNRSGHFYPKDGFYIYFDQKTEVVRDGGNDDAQDEASRNNGNDSTDRQARKTSYSGKKGRQPDNQDIRERCRIRANRETREQRSPSEDLVIIECEENKEPRARYREWMYGSMQEHPADSAKWFGSAAVIVAVLLLFAIIGTGIRQGRISIEGIEQTVESISMKVLPQTGEADTETAEESVAEASTETAAKAGGDSGTQDVSAILKEMEQTAADAEIIVEEVPQGDILN